MKWFHIYPHKQNMILLLNNFIISYVSVTTLLFFYNGNLIDCNARDKIFAMIAIFACLSSDKSKKPNKKTTTLNVHNQLMEDVIIAA